MQDILKNCPLQYHKSFPRHHEINANCAINFTMLGRPEVGEPSMEDRAEYVKEIMQQLADALTKEFGRGYSYRNHKLFRQFYLTYSKDEDGCAVSDETKEMIFIIKNQKGQTPYAQSDIVPCTSDGKRFFLSWSHYVILIRIKDVLERHFYEIETYNNNWSKRELIRQYDSGLYLRLIKSKNKQKVLNFLLGDKY